MADRRWDVDVLERVMSGRMNKINCTEEKRKVFMEAVFKCVGEVCGMQKVGCGCVRKSNE